MQLVILLAENNVVVLKDGDKLWWLVHMRPLVNLQGKLIRFKGGSFTWLVRATQKHIQNKKLTANTSEQLFSLIVTKLRNPKKGTVGKQLSPFVSMTSCRVIWKGSTWCSRKDLKYTDQYNSLIDHKDRFTNKIISVFAKCDCTKTVQYLRLKRINTL